MSIPSAERAIELAEELDGKIGWAGIASRRSIALEMDSQSEIVAILNDYAELRAKAEAQAVPVAIRIETPNEMLLRPYSSVTHGAYQHLNYPITLLYTAPPAQAVSVPFDIEEYLSAYEWRAEDGGLSELTTRDRQLLQDFANGLPLYTALPAQAVSVPKGSYQLTLNKHEVEALADYHDYVQEEAYSCGSECEGNKLRAAELRAMLAAPSPAQTVSVPTVAEVFAAFDELAAAEACNTWTGGYKDKTEEGRRRRWQANNRIQELRAMLAASPQSEQPT